MSKKKWRRRRTNEEKRIDREENQRMLDNLLSAKIKLQERLRKMHRDTITEVIKDHWELHSAALFLYAKDECFICGNPISWDNIESRGLEDGRMYNIMDKKTLEPEYWITICRGCLSIKILKETLEESF